MPGCTAGSRSAHGPPRTSSHRCCSPGTGPLLVPPLPEGLPSQEEDFAFAVVEFNEVPVSPFFFQPV